MKHTRMIDEYDNEDFDAFADALLTVPTVADAIREFSLGQVLDSTSPVDVPEGRCPPILYVGICDTFVMMYSLDELNWICDEVYIPTSDEFERNLENSDRYFPSIYVAERVEWLGRRSKVFKRVPEGMTKQEATDLELARVQDAPNPAKIH